ncbi:MAG: diguanylate cyclase [Candidatus Omnitrophota bacterium]|nr:MAG: diguanylate cyclase [Candidatus Omnitrophota bacterium]
MKKQKKFFEKFSLLPQGLRYKLLIAFSLMSIIPLLVIGYLINNLILLEEKPSFAQISLMVLFSIIIAWLGLFLARRIIERVIDIALEIRIITEGNYDRKIFVDTGDEIGQIGEAINFLTKRIKDNISDLKDYQGKLKEINLDVQKRVTVLSNLLQISELISSSAKLDVILELILNKLAQLYEGGFAAVYFFNDKDKRFTLRSSYNLKSEGLLTAKIEEGKGFLGKAISKGKHLIIDASSKFSSAEQEFKLVYKCENLAVFPISMAYQATAVVIFGNNIKNFTFTNDDIEIIKIFVEQVSIAIENEFLIKKAEKLEIKDKLTGLFNKSYMLHRLDEEIKRSIVCRRPCSFILVDIDDFKKYESEKGRQRAEAALKKIADLIKEFSTQVGKTGVLGIGNFALILPEVNKKEALEIAEKVRKRIEKLELSSEKDDRLTASAGVSENPLDGSSGNEILEKGEIALKSAKKEGKNKIVAARR